MVGATEVTVVSECEISDLFAQMAGEGYSAEHIVRKARELKKRTKSPARAGIALCTVRVGMPSRDYFA
ncbi:hypothetical protein Cenrod_1935 [Candidatus Symbiobacter mobilis CR]|uniref:Uncharacterized protein n=1 Tax=Candidatus Symbiobacter mobilis CR TaxID=946483 RepID=U5NCQ3_9BURK|nr:hypothetical protein Cenrod_1935 [Candidatus Symbiobacter mobilis CR]